MERMNPEHLNKFRPRARKSGEPRSARDEQLDIYVARLNAANIKDGYPKVTYARVATMLKGVPEGELKALYDRCSTYRSFGAGLKDQLRKRASPE